MNRFIPEEIVREIQDKTDIYEVISSYIPLKKNGTRWKALCPFHQEKTPSFIVSPERQSFHCFGCGKGGSAFQFIMEKENVGFVEAAYILAGRCGITIPETTDNSMSKEERGSKNQRTRTSLFYASNTYKSL